ncbi:MULTISPECIES: sensor domain-containing diguanylate cyclase [Achromobacter]|uniref:sensor domain-containing diguanylate cyclase n=1 Tax=Achromobacter sp. SD115 TaxID=2782011 RepID=UPI001F6112E8|nr:sensor domain-containing diguanylate cyclase [Achromobacter sp. SD115]
MRIPSSDDVAHAQVLAAQNGRILAAASAILAAGQDSFFQTLAGRAVQDMGTDYAWVRLDQADDAAGLIASASCREGIAADLAGADEALHALLADRAAYACLDGMPQDEPWLSEAGVQACVVRTLYDANAVACGRIVFAFRRALADVSAYANAQDILAAYAQHAVLGVAARDRELARLNEVIVQFGALFRTAPVLINAFDADGRCTLWNDACARRFGWSEAEIKQSPDPFALFYPDPSVRDRAMDSVVARPDRSFREWQPRTRDGELLSVLWSNVRLPDGKVVNLGMDVTESRRAEAALARMARVDSLTGCWNRAEILKRMEDRLAGGRHGEGGPTTALMLDLDYFKQVNDRYGHLGGDVALRHFCDQLRTCLREGDSIGRLGGEEFLVLLADADAAVARAICERLRASLRQHPADIDGAVVTLSVSGGIAGFLPGDATASDVLRRADFALYQAKRSGRDCAVEYRS